MKHQLATFAHSRITLLVLVTALLTVLALISFLSLGELETMEDSRDENSYSSEMMPETRISNALYVYPVLTELEKYMIIVEKYETIDIRYKND